MRYRLRLVLGMIFGVLLSVPAAAEVQKLAALMIILGPESAAQILRTLETRELEIVSAEMAKLPVITQEVRNENGIAFATRGEMSKPSSSSTGKRCTGIVRLPSHSSVCAKLAGARSSKLQIPSTKETPIFKLQ